MSSFDFTTNWSFSELNRPCICREFRFWLYNKLIFLRINWSLEIFSLRFWLYNKLIFLRICVVAFNSAWVVLTLQQIDLSQNLDMFNKAVLVVLTLQQIDLSQNTYQARCACLSVLTLQQIDLSQNMRVVMRVAFIGFDFTTNWSFSEFKAARARSALWFWLYNKLIFLRIQNPTRPLMMVFWLYNKLIFLRI